MFDAEVERVFIAVLQEAAKSGYLNTELNRLTKCRNLGCGHVWRSRPKAYICPRCGKGDVFIVDKEYEKKVEEEYKRGASDAKI
jgi:hypothetical protein